MKIAIFTNMVMMIHGWHSMPRPKRSPFPAFALVLMKLYQNERYDSSVDERYDSSVDNCEVWEYNVNSFQGNNWIFREITFSWFKWGVAS